MSQQGQLIRLKRTGRDGEPMGAYRYRVGGRDSRRVQRGGFASECDAAEALERELERLRREQRVARSLTLAELVEAYLAQHDVDPVTIEKLRWLLGKAVAVFGDRPVGEQRPFESWAELDAVAARLAPRYAPMVIFAAATGLSSSRMDRARTARRRSPGAGRLRPPFVHEGSAEVDEDRGEPAGSPAASDRPGCDRTPAAQSEQPRCCFRASGAATSTCTTSATASGSPPSAPPGSSLCAGSTIF